MRGAPGSTVTRWILRGVVSLLVAAGRAGATDAAPPDETPGVLILDSGDPSRPAAIDVYRGIRQSLPVERQPVVPVYAESTDLYRFGGPEGERHVREHLAARYGHRRLGAILALGDPMTRLLLEWGERPWRGVPIVAAMIDPDVVAMARGTPDVTGFTIRVDVEGTLDAALRLFPGTRRVAVVAGQDPYLGVLEAALATRRPALEAIRLVDLSLEETKRGLAALPSDAIVLYGGIYVDGTGRRFTPQYVLESLVRSSRRPVFGYLETYLGYGLVGGSLLDLELAGREAGGLVKRALAGEPPESIPIFEARTSRLIFDGRQLDRWGVSDAVLPAGSVVRFREEGLWHQHRTTFLAVALVLILQTALIGMLLVETRHRRRTQKQLRELSARLVAAQEQERTRIAQELHDDVNQRLALFAIELDQLGGDERRSSAELREQMEGLSRRARALSRDVHRIAYELHPAILDQLGLVPALRRFADDLSRHGIAVAVKAERWPDELPRDLALAFYRVAQEALQNVARHSGAREAGVVLRGTASHLTLTVSDDGKGFRPDRRGSHLGLVGMRERLRQVGGQLVVDSSPERGTLVAAAIPMEVVALRGFDERLARLRSMRQEDRETLEETAPPSR